jgi:hypothetical protein
MSWIGAVSSQQRIQLDLSVVTVHWTCAIQIYKLYTLLDLFYNNTIACSKIDSLE